MLEIVPRDQIRGFTDPFTSKFICFCLFFGFSLLLCLMVKMAEIVMRYLMVKIAPIFRYGFTMWKKEDQQMVPTEFRLIKEMSRFIISFCSEKQLVKVIA